MPTYEYHCDACDYNFDEFQSMTEPPLKQCPQCKKPKLRRVFGTGAAVLFRGTGFYETDYRSESYKQAAKADQEATSKASGNGTDATPCGNGTACACAGGKGKKSESKSSKS